MRRETKGWRNELQLRRGVKQLLRVLQLDPPLDVGGLCERLAQHRNRPISLMPYPLPAPGVFGLWIGTSVADYILYQRDTTAAHQEHIILHEVGHIVSNHGSEGNEEIWNHLFPDIPPEMVRRVLQREGYGPACEREAEMVATVIKEWATLLDRLRFAPVRKTAAARRLRGAFDDHQAWL
jgi:hypothetical protein